MTPQTDESSSERAHCLYVLPYPKFFSQHAGVGGHVAHAAGVISGLIEAGYAVDVVAEEHHAIFPRDHCDVALLSAAGTDPLSRQFWGFRFLRFLGGRIKHSSPEFCYMRYSASFAPWIPSLKRMLGDVPLILEVNSVGSQWTKLMRLLDRRALRAADRVICISNVLREQLGATLGNDGHPDIRVVMNGVDVGRFPGNSAAGPGRQPMQVGYAGLLKPGYGLETIVEAGRMLDPSKVVLNVYGDGPFLDELKRLSADVPALRVHGAIPFLDMPTCLLEQDILLYVTGPKYIYQSPTKLFEYLAAGRPIVCATTPQTRELLEKQGCAVMFPVSDARGLVDALTPLLDDAVAREAMGARARTLAIAEHSWLSRVHAVLR